MNLVKQNLDDTSNNFPKSIWYESYNYYYDLIFRHISMVPVNTDIELVKKFLSRLLRSNKNEKIEEVKGKNKIDEQCAFACEDQQGNLVTYSYLDLHNLISEEATKWVNNNISCGNKIVIVNIEGIKLVVLVLTALKLGCVFSVLYTSSLQYLDKLSLFLLNTRIENINPDYIFCEANQQSLDPKYDSKIVSLPSVEFALSASDKKSIKEPPHTYQPDELVCISFEYCSENNCDPVFISAESLYLDLVRNGDCILGLTRPDILVFPYLNKELYQYGLLLTSMMSGSTYLSLTDKVPKCMIDSSLVNRLNNYLPELGSNYVIGVTPQFHKELISEELKECRYWFAMLHDRKQQKQWSDLITKYRIDESKSHFLHWESALNSFSLLSIENDDSSADHVYPVPSKEFTLTDMFTKKKSVTGMGLYNVAITKERDFSSQVVLTKQELGYSYFEQDYLKEDGIFFPETAITAYLNEKTAPQTCCYFVPNSLMNGNRLLLLVFDVKLIKDTTDYKKALEEQIKILILDTLGSLFKPDDIIFYCYQPRGHLLPDPVTKEKLYWLPDNDGVISQFLSGDLELRSSDKFSHGISLYRYFIKTLALIAN